MAAILAVAPALAGCESMDDFDLDKLDVFGINKKKPLPGDRRDVFPGGVPGVTQGIPPEYLKENVEKQQQAEAAAAAEQERQQAAQDAEAAKKKAEAAEEAEKAKARAEAKAKAKPKPKPQVVRLPAKPATQVTVQPTRQPAQQAPWPAANQPPPNQQQSSQAPWPSTAQQPQQAQQQDPAWNTAPPPPAGTFSR
ncbi:MAG TPA: hypothetical protein VFB31_04425 [Pseudolabrys sp.]|nr:hypothetical protein [Pseudolabrys sp.]